MEQSSHEALFKLVCVFVRSRGKELEAAGVKKIEIGRLIDQAAELGGVSKTAFAEGTIEEKRLFLRAFLKSIELDPVGGKGQAMFTLLPGVEKMTDAITVDGQHLKLPSAK